MHWWQALVLGVVEGVTEYLPISSTGHLILTQWFLGLSENLSIKAAVDSFDIVIQAGAIVAVLGLYHTRVRQIFLGILGKDILGLRLGVNLVIGFLPAAIVGLLLHKTIKLYLFSLWPVVLGLFIGALLMLAVAKSQKINDQEQAGKEVDDLSWQMALLIGLGQCLALWPGMSRSMMTIVPGLFLGLKRKDAAEFSFLLGLVTLGAATCYEGYKEGAQMISQIGLENMLIGFMAATVSAAMTVKWFVGFLVKRGLLPFVWYRFVVSAVFALLVMSGLIGVS